MGSMSGSALEGDLVRPLGFVTLYWAYAEAQLDEVLGALFQLSGSVPNGKVLLFGAKVPIALGLIEALKVDRLSALSAILQEAQTLIQVRNELIHGQLFNGGRLGGRLVLKSGTKYVTAQEISDIAEAIFNWKERLWVQHCRELLPMLQATAAQPTVQGSTSPPSAEPRLEPGRWAT